MARDQGAYASAANSGQQANSVFGTDWAAVQNQMNPSAATKGALTQLPMDAANSAFGAAQGNATNRMARTNNSAGYGSQMDDLAQKKAQADAQATLQGQNSIQNLQNEGIKNAGQLFGVADSSQTNLYNAGSNAVGASYDWTKALQPVGQVAQGFLGTNTGKKV